MSQGIDDLIHALQRYKRLLLQVLIDDPLKGCQEINRYYTAKANWFQTLMSAVRIETQVVDLYDQTRRSVRLSLMSSADRLDLFRSGDND